MKRGVLLFLSVLLISILSSVIYAQDLDSIIKAKDAELEVRIRSDFEIIPTEPNYAISYLEAKTSFYPIGSYREEILDIVFDPKDYTIEEDMIQFKWDDPSKRQYSYEIISQIKTSGEPVKVKREINFPSDSDRFKEYSEPTSNIDSDDPDIQALAQELTQGKNDYYNVIYTLAKWVNNNIDYQRNEKTENETQAASWVLENKIGVCDEFTNLFMALLKTLKIPCRYVSGISYTNDNSFDYDFGPHGWAEVYFPDYGWIPFDATYGQYGFVDASHVSLKKSKDSADPSTHISCKSRNVKINKPISKTDTKVISIGEELDSILDVSQKAIKDKVGFGSFNLIEATIKNTKNYYVPARIRLSDLENMQINTENPQFLLFKPDEIKKIYWVVKVNKNLHPSFTYTFPFTISTSRKETETKNFKVTENSNSFTEQDMQTLKEQKEEEFEKTYSQLVTFYCEPEKEITYQNETPTLDCNLKNMGDSGLEDIEVCARNRCTKIDVGADDEKDFSLELYLDKFGEQEIIITAKNDDISKSDMVDMIYMKYPEVKLKSMKFPEKIEYNKDFQIKFVVTGKNNPLDLKVNLHVNSLSKTWRINKLTKDREFIIKLNSRDLYPVDNNISVKIIYDDARDRSYAYHRSYTMELENLEWWRKIILYSKLYLKNVQDYLERTLK